MAAAREAKIFMREGGRTKSPFLSTYCMPIHSPFLLIFPVREGRADLLAGLQKEPNGLVAVALCPLFGASLRAKSKGSPLLMPLFIDLKGQIPKAAAQG